MKIESPIRLGNGLNDRMFWAAAAKMRKKEKAAVGWLLTQFERPTTPCTFTLTRIAPSGGLDDDNLAGSWKAGRDAIADWMGVDDKHREIVAYEYRNERGPWGVRIEA